MSKNEKKIDYFKWRDRKKLPVSIDIRLLESDDYDKGFIELLPILLNRDISVIRRSIGSKEKFTSRVDKMNGSFNINVIEHFGEIIATCSMILEYKRGVDTTQYLIGQDHKYLLPPSPPGEWNNKMVGFGDTAIVHPGYRRQGIARALWQYSIEEVGRKSGCYKIVADSPYRELLISEGFTDEHNITGDDYELMTSHGKFGYWHRYLHRNLNK